MYLTNEEERMLKGDYGYGYRKAMEILVALGEIYGADRLIDIESAHISGVSYKNLGEEGLDFLKEMARDSRVRVRTTVNPGGFDLGQWRQMAIDRGFIAKQLEVINTFRSMGIEATLTCTPYYSQNLPRSGEHVAWAESSAVTLINSVIGAYTNRESGISALASALVGKTPNYGLHTYEGREPKITVEIKFRLREIHEYGIIGYLVANRIGNLIPYFRGLGRPTMDMVKYLSASLSTYGGIPMFHIEDVTPESKNYEPPTERIVIDVKEFKDTSKRLRDDLDAVDMVWIGCPHASLDEIKYVADKVRGRKLVKRLVITTSRDVLLEAMKEDYISVIRLAGGEVYADTCIIVSPMGAGLKGVVTSSSKAYYYLRGVNKSKVYVASIDKCIDFALGGEL